MPTRLSISRPQRGFALLITITLLAFLVLLLVSLASLTRVETQVASNSQQSAQARQNALMALNIALGELQKYTGPDQRTTARSDMDPSLANTTTASGRWLGAYGNGAAADYAEAPSSVSTTIVTAANGKGSTARLLNWLVSGNETTAFSPSAHVGAKGEITTAPTVFPFAPSAAVAGLSSSANALTDTLTVADRNHSPQPARLLVGPNTVGDSVADYVVAPLKEIEAESPGMGATAVPVGRYAWWVGDEGTKARVNLPMADADQARAAFSNARRAAVELVDAVHPSGAISLAATDMLDPTGASSRYDPGASELGRLLSADQLPLLSTAGAGVLGTVSKYRYHDLGAWSRSVLSDTYAGGLKKDLSAALATGATSPANTDLIFPAEPNTTTSSYEFGLPTWRQLRSYVQTRATSVGLTPAPPGMVKLSQYKVPIPTTIGIGPVMTYATVGFAYGVPQDAPAPFDQPGNTVRLAAFPIVVLWNPYTTDMKPGRYEVGFRKTTNGYFELQAHDGPHQANYVWNSSNVIESKTLQTVNGASDPFLRFVINNSGGIPAGQSLVFTLAATGAEYQPGANELTNAYNYRNHILMPPPSGGPHAITQEGRTYRVGVNGFATPASRNNTPRTAFNDSTSNFWGAYTADCYLGTEGGPRPTSNLPYTNTFTSRQWYQGFAGMETYTPDSPYGTNAGYSSTPGTHGLFRQPGPIDMIFEPTFRMSFRAGFVDSKSRWIVQGNPRGFVVAPPDKGGTNMLGPVNFTARMKAQVHETWPPALTVSFAGGARTSSGMGLDYTTPSPIDTVLFEFIAGDRRLLSIGQLQHANLAWQSCYPSYAIGNSSGDPFMLMQTTSDASTLMVPTQAGLSNPFSGFYDMSFLLNRALWDRYFVSTIPNAGTGLAADTSSTAIPDTLPNPRHVRYDTASAADLRNTDRAAAHLLLAGGFNINSTSEQAWRAVLGGINRLPYDPVAADTGSPLKVAISRFARPLAAPPATIDATTAWSGYRELTATQIAQLAQNIVAEIRNRGPFISLADFINRRLKDDGVFPLDNDKRLKGAIQAALDAPSSITGANAINNAANAPFSGAMVAQPDVSAPTQNAFQSGSASGGTAALTHPISSTSAFAPQYLTQGDILSAIGSGLAGRSDTFTIRSYGEVVNPALAATDPGYVASRAWCEAVVQRVPDFVDTSLPAETDLAAAPSSAAKTTNQTFGRRYKVVSFRWLNASDI
ncbi:MAG TPA: hypothetical protein VIO38_17000 [Rariglobus sp.]